MTTDRYTVSPPILTAPEFRTALGVAASIAMAGDPNGVMCGRVIGHPDLVEQFGKYCEIVDDLNATLVTLSADPCDVLLALDVSRAERIVTLTRGSGAESLRRFRASSFPLTGQLPSDEWTTLGYRLVRSFGVQGVASTIWAAFQRISARASRDHLADRSRVAMLQTLVTASPVSRYATVVIREYRCQQ